MSTLSILLVLGSWIAPQQLEQELERQERALRELEARFETHEQEARELRAALELQQPPCSAELRPVDGSTARNAVGDEYAIVRFNLLGTVSRPTSRCLPASVWLTASYLNGDGDLICSGSVTDLATQTALNGNVSVEVQPWNLVNFARWANQPPPTETGFLRLDCRSPDGLVEVRTLPEATAGVSLRISLFPPGGGLATSEFFVNLR